MVSRKDKRKSGIDSNKSSKRQKLGDVEKFSPDELKLLIYAIDEAFYGCHGEMLYKAKVVKRRIKDDKPQYYVHYDGWNKRYDEWVSHDKMFGFNDENQKYKEQQDTMVKEKKTAKTQKKSTPVEKITKLKKEEDPTIILGEKAPKELEIPMPDILKRILAMDWEEITRKQKLVKLPAPETESVDSIIEKYRVYARENKLLSAGLLREITDGLHEYFNTVCPVVLLYNSEKPQRDDLLDLKPKPEPSKVYGAVHLVRLFVKLPFLLAHAQEKNGEHCKLLCEKMAEFLKYIGKYFETHKVEYVPTDKAYTARLKEKYPLVIRTLKQ
eukprot:1256_1